MVCIIIILPDDPDSFITLVAYSIILSDNIFKLVVFNICLPVSTYGLSGWFMLLTLFTQLIYVSLLYWIVGVYYYEFLVNENLSHILVIPTFCPSILSILYSLWYLSNHSYYIVYYFLYMYLIPIIFYIIPSYLCYTHCSLILLLYSSYL